MDKRKTNYFKELVSHANIFVTALIGTLLGLIMFFVDKYNMAGRLLIKLGVGAKLTSVVMPALYGMLYTAIAVVVLIVLIKALNTKWQREDTLLVSFDFFAVTVFLTTLIGLNEGASKTAFAIVLLALAAVLTIVRALRVVEAEEELTEKAMNEYKVAIAKKYNVPVLVALGLVFGVGIGLLLHYVDVDAFVGKMFAFWQESSKVEKIGYVAGLAATLTLGFNLYTICNYKRSKVNLFDALLVIGTIATFFTGIFFALKTDRFLWNYHIWYFATLAFAATLIVRSINVNSKVESKKELGKVALYNSEVSKKVSIALVLIVAAVVSGSLIKLDVVGFAKAFATSENIIATLLGLGGSLVLVVLGIFSLVRDHFSAKRVIALDFVLLTSLVIAGVMLFDLVGAYTIVKLIIYVVALVVVLFLLFKRINDSRFETEVVEEKVEETPVEEEKVPTEEVSEVAETDSVEETLEETTETIEEVEAKDKLVIRKTKFINKLKFAPARTKKYYAEIKNLLLSYGAKSKIARKNEVFRKSGLLAKITLSGKSIRVHLPLNPNDEERFPSSKYHQFSLEQKKQFSEVPFTIKVKSDRGLKRALELIELVCTEKPLKKKKKFEPLDFTKELEVNGEAIFEKLGLQDQMTDIVNKEYLERFFENQNEEFLNELMNLIPTVEKKESSEGETQNVYIDTVLDKLNSDVISLETLKEENIISKSTNNICVKIHEDLNKAIVVECDEITPEACVAVLALNGKVFLKK